MPSDMTTAEFHDHARSAPLRGPLRGDDSRQMPAGAGLAIGVLAGATFWAGVAAFFLL